MKKRHITAALVSIGFLVTGLAGCGDQAAKASPTVVRPIKVMTVKNGASSSEMAYPGKIQSGRKVDLSFRVAGPLVELPVRPGQMVTEGDLIARIDPRDFQINVDKAEAAFTEAQSNYNRQSKLLKKKVVSKAAFDSSRRAYLTAKAALDQVKSALEDTRLRAPFSGVVARTFVENHQEVKAKDPVISLQDNSNLEVTVQVPERDVLFMRSWPEYELKVVLDALPDREFSAQVKEFAAEADSRTQTFTMTVTLDRPDGINVLPGMTAELRLRLKRADGENVSGFTVPVEAVLVDDDNKSFVWTLDHEKMAVLRRSVKVGDMTGDRIVILDGLSIGDTIAVAGVHHLTEGMTVSLLETEKEPQAQ